MTNPESANNDWPPAVIAGAYQTGVLATRTLLRRGVRAVLFDSDPAMPGFSSRYGPAHRAPDPDVDPEGWIEFMRNLAISLGGQRPALIASADQFVSAISRHEDALREHYLLSPGVALQGALATKQTQYELAAQHGMPMPETRLVRSTEELSSFAEVAAFPCVLKPLHFREWQRLPAAHPLASKKVAVAQSPEELQRHWQHAQALGPAVVQELIQGPDTAKRVYLACYDARGRRIGHALFRELRCQPFQMGPASVTEPVEDAGVDDVCDRFLRSVGYRGVCEIEVKRDERDGRVKLIEANPRLSGGGDAAPYAGVDLCWLHYLDLIGKEVVPVTPDSRHFRHVVLRSDARAIRTYRKAGLLSWKDIWRSYRAPLAFYDLDPADWRYSLETLLIVAREAIRALIHWGSGGRFARLELP